jgi:hypothetical protein
MTVTNENYLKVSVFIDETGNKQIEKLYFRAVDLCSRTGR